ncbi:MAG: aminotransferase class IV [Hydrococcus sp. C42_A2020_068]|uniref:aminotransferase class IV n=1 Tax=Pleurocapsa sp. PCC 7327 TaxID=118163 RepID=UPI00029FFAD6|nr:aminotransferase class IV [Pleurocapsa sp. PCC 7327]AFY78857.1 branched-chain amino acid aminotransferase/4-amino-4-deoxychorismate lyase [Pleurocapsa sp. PCC 7327]MBF2020589.1 aminotransferase class IV [Hydrococcus sp. C42_A2020_068]
MFWYDGELIEGDSLSIGIDDPGLLYGATVFTTLRVYDRSLDRPLTHWQLHCDRLRHSIQAFEWQSPDWRRLRQGVEILLAYYPVLRIAIFADGREWIIGQSLPVDLKERQQQGIVGWVADESLYRRSLAAYKTGNYLSAWLARQKAQKLGAKEAILLDEAGNWLETSTGNLWGWKEECWWTPALEEKLLPGIARSQLIEWLQSQNIPVKQNRWTPEFVRDLEAIAYSNSVMEIIPFSLIIHPLGKQFLNCNLLALEHLRSYFLT